MRLEAIVAKHERILKVLQCLIHNSSGGAPYSGIVTNYSALPSYSSHQGEVWMVKNSEGSKWIPTWLGGSYYPKGYYFADTTGWSFVGEFPYQATNAEALNNTITDRFISPATLDYWKSQQTFGGDMLKSVYDPNDDGKVNSAVTADNVDWSGVQNKPLGFNPSAHSHLIADVTNLQTTLDGKSNVGHTHVIADTTGLQTALDNKSPVVHTHTIPDVVGLSTALSGKSDVGHTHIVQESFGLNTLGGNSDISLGMKGFSRIKSNGVLSGFRIDSFETGTGNPISGNISIEIKKNGTLMGTVNLNSSSLLDNTLSGWTTSILKEDKIQYEVVSNSGIKNFILTFYYNSTV